MIEMKNKDGTIVRVPDWAVDQMLRRGFVHAHEPVKTPVPVVRHQTPADDDTE